MDAAHQRAALQTDWITTLEGLRGLRVEWDDLLAADPHSTVFQSWEWVTSWFEQFAGDRKLQVLTLRDSSGRLVGLVPSTLTVVKRVLRVIDVLGRGNYLTEYTEAIVDPAFAHLAPRAIADAWERLAPEWDRLQLHNIAVAGQLGSVVQSLSARGFDVYLERNAAVRRSMPATWEQFFRSLHKGMRDQLNNYVNRLRRQGHAVELVIAPPGDLDNAAQTLMRLHSLRSQARHLPLHRDYFDTPAKREFFQDVARRLADRGMMEIALLMVDGEAVAAQACLYHRDRFATYYSGYDPAWASYSVMMVLTRMAIEHAIERGFDQLDMMCGPTPDKLRWGGEVVPLTSAVITGPRIRSRIGFVAHRARVFRKQLVRRAGQLRRRRR